MVGKCSIFIFLFFLVATSSGQTIGSFWSNFSYEAGISIGPMNSLTDLGGSPGYGTSGPKDLNIKSTKLFGSIYVSAAFNRYLAVRLEGTFGSIKSNDSLLKGLAPSNKAIGRYNRNLSFRSPIYEISLTAEFHPFDIFPNYFSPFSPYIIGGIGFFHFNPQANLNGKWVDLQPLHTEGQGFAEYPLRKEYKLNQFNVPLGVGIAYQASSKMRIRLEFINRITGTDYLDDVHDTYIDPQLFSKYLKGNLLQEALVLNNRGRADAIPNLTTAHPGGRRGNPLDNDSYFTINIKFGYIFGDSGNGGGGFRGSGRSGRNEREKSKIQKNQRRCPVRF